MLDEAGIKMPRRASQSAGENDWLVFSLRAPRQQSLGHRRGRARASRDDAGPQSAACKRGEKARLHADEARPDDFSPRRVSYAAMPVEIIGREMRATPPPVGHRPDS